MTSKTTLSLIEQIIMILVFALAAAICLSIFVYSNNLSKDNEIRDVAVLEARNAAEVLKQTHGNCDEALALSAAGDKGLELSISPVETGSDYLGKALITITDGSDEIYSLEVCWQEVSP